MKDKYRSIQDVRRFMTKVTEHESDAIVKALEAIYLELNRAKHNHPDWPKDIIHQAAIVAEESGELLRAAIQQYYEAGDSTDNIIKEAIQTGAMSLRILVEMAEDMEGRSNHTKS